MKPEAMKLIKKLKKNSTLRAENQNIHPLPDFNQCYEHYIVTS